VEFPNTNIVRNVPRLLNSSAIYWGGQSFWIHLYWPQHAHSHWQHSPPQAQLKGSSCSSAIPSSTRGMPFRAQLEECHMLNPYLELNSRDMFRAQLKEHQQSHLWSFTKSLVDHSCRIQQLNAATSKITWRGTHTARRCRSQTARWVMRTAKRQVPQVLLVCRYRLAEPPWPPGATRSEPLCFCNLHLAVRITPSCAILEQCVYWFCSTFTFFQF